MKQRGLNTSCLSGHIRICLYLTFSRRLVLGHHSRSLWSSLSLGCPLSKHLSLQDLELSALLRLSDRENQTDVDLEKTHC